MEITLEKIRVYPNPVLRKKARAIIEVTEKEQALFDLMALVMQEGQGIGLAAPQIGEDLCVIIATNGPDIFKIANPKIIEKKGKSVLEEGCLSLPGITVKVKRAKYIVVKGIDYFNRELKIEADGLFAHILQHEIDHLYGKLIIDYASLSERIRMFEAIMSLRRQYQCQAAKTCPPRL